MERPNHRQLDRRADLTVTSALNQSGYKVLTIFVLLILAVGFYLVVDIWATFSTSLPLSLNDAQTTPAFVAVASGYIDVEGGVSTIAVSLDGMIKDVFVAEGDWVVPGQVLATQERKVEQINLSRAKSTLDGHNATQELLAIKIKAAHRELTRLTPLYQIGAVTHKDFDLANDAVSQLQIEKKMNIADISAAVGDVEQARFMLVQRTIRSPSTGQIVNVKARTGLRVSAFNASTLFTLIPNAPKVVRALVDESSQGDIHNGQPANVYRESLPGRFFSATVIRISPYFKLGDTRQGLKAKSEKAQFLDVLLSLAPTAPSSSSLRIGQKVQVKFLQTMSEKSEINSPVEAKNKPIQSLLIHQS
jgi:multidrug resistance efflux pump